MEDLRVCHFIKQGCWNVSDLNLPRDILDAIIRTTIHSDRDDWPIWVPTNASELTTKTVYEEVRARGQRGHWNDLFWFKNYIPKFSFMAWW